LIDEMEEELRLGFEGKRNPCDFFTGPDRLIPPAMQHGKQPFWAPRRVSRRRK
jgi:hypothetical protein